MTLKLQKKSKQKTVKLKKTTITINYNPPTPNFKT